MGAGEEILKELRALRTEVRELRAICSSNAAAGGATTGIKPASDADLDDQYGDPEIRKDPKRWTGPSFVGRKYSDTSPEYLDCVAEFKVWQAGKDDETNAVDSKGRPKSHWARKDAALAAGWARRLRAGYAKPKATTPAASYEAPAYGAPRSPSPAADDGFGYGGGYEGPDPF